MLYKRIIINGKEYKLAVNQSGSGAPTSDAEGAPGVLYMDTDTEALYKCTDADTDGGVYSWSELVTGGDALESPVFRVEITENGGTYTANFGHKEIREAIVAGKTPVAFIGNDAYQYSALDVANSIFCNVDKDRNVTIVMIGMNKSVRVSTNKFLIESDLQDNLLTNPIKVLLQQTDDGTIGVYGYAEVDEYGNFCGEPVQTTDLEVPIKAYMQGRMVYVDNETSNIPCISASMNDKSMFFGVTVGVEGFAMSMSITIENGEVTVDNWDTDSWVENQLSETINSMIDAKIEALDARGVAY